MVVIESLVQSDSSRLEKKENERFVLCANMPTTGAVYPKAASSFVQGIYHDSPRSALTHRCRVWISADICVWWEALGLTGLAKATPSHPHVLRYHIQNSPQAPDQRFHRVRAPPLSRGSRQDLNDVSTKADKWEENWEADNVGRFHPFYVLSNRWRQILMTQCY